MGEPVARKHRGLAVTPVPQHLEVVVGDDGAMLVPAPEVAHLGTRPGEHLRLVRGTATRVRRGRKKIRGILVGKIDPIDVLTEQDFDDARRARVEAVERRFGPAKAEHR